MLSEDRKIQHEENIKYLEYLASFWNAEAVSKVRDAREASSNSSKSDEEFEREIKENLYKEDEIVKQIRERYKNTNLNNNNTTFDNQQRRLPKNLDGIRKLFED
jgi:hypothetical protein